MPQPPLKFKNPAAKSRRKPGILWRLTQRVPASAPQWIKDYTRELDQLLAKIWFAIDNSLPALHGQTHIGGNDNIISDDLPQTLTLTRPADAGTPQSGASAADHVHELDLDFVANPVPPEGVEGSPNPPFRTLKRQLEFHLTHDNLAHALRPISAQRWR